ncbi:MAG: DNA polymerase IV, partial [Devosia sp.]
LELSMGLAGENRRPGTKRGASRWIADKAMDKVRGKFGWEAIGYANVVLEGVRSVPDGFRELAEKEL